MKKNVILATGLYSGLFSGMVLTGLIMFFVKPLIYRAELISGEVTSVNSKLMGTLIGAILLATIFGLLLAIVYDRLSLERFSWWIVGGLTGFGGWIIFTLIPAAAYPPSPPGVHGSLDVSVRQIWWMVVFAAGVFAPIISYAGYRLLRRFSHFFALIISIISGFAIVTIPILIRPADILSTGEISASVINQFRFTTVSINLLFWLVLGYLTVIFYKKNVPSNGQV